LQEYAVYDVKLLKHGIPPIWQRLPLQTKCVTVTQCITIIIIIVEQDLQLSFSFVVKPRGKTEVSNLDLHVVVQEEITELQVAMYYLRSVKVGARQRHLTYEITTLRLCDHVPTLVKLQQRLSTKRNVKLSS